MYIISYLYSIGWYKKPILKYILSQTKGKGKKPLNYITTAKQLEQKKEKNKA